MGYEDPLFVSAQDAVSFSTNFNHAIVPRSSMLRMMNPSNGHGRGLSGLDGAGQAGLILSEVDLLPTILQRAIPIARTAPHNLVCLCGKYCCSGKRPNWQWLERVELIKIELDRIQEERRTPGTRGQELIPRLRLALIARFFGERSSLEEIAQACEVSPITVSSHRKFVNRELKLAEHTAWEILDDRLRSLGIVGELP